MKQVSLDQLSSGQLRELVGTSFAITVGSGILVSFKLSAVSPDRPHESAGGFPEGAGFESFALVFDGPTDPVVGQGTYRLTHEGLGWFDLFIVPIGADQNGRRYEAVFNRRLPSGTRS